MRRIAGCLVFITGCGYGQEASTPAIDEIVRRGGEVLQADWKAWTVYSYVERDETRKGNQISSRTSRVVIIAGSDYYLPLAYNDKPLTSEQHNSELQKLRAEVSRRNNESPEARAQRIAAFRKQQDENSALILEFPKALTYSLAGEEDKNGHPAYVLAAAPKKRAGPLSRAAKVLSGMGGTVWVDRESFHTIRGDCRVMAPVPIFGVLARVMPGTHIEIELAPVTGSVWLIRRYTLAITVSKLWFKSSQTTDSTYAEFRPNADVLSELLEESTQ